MRRKGFTLIELLVVIAIIGILAAMLFPVFARAREAARKTQCLSNTKNICLAVLMYANDFDDATYLFPYGWDSRANVGTCGYGGAKWKGNPFLREPVILEEYIKNRDIWRCPSAKIMNGAGMIIPLGRDGLWWNPYLDNVWDNSQSNPSVISPCMRAFPPGWGGDVTDSFVQGLAPLDTMAVGQGKGTKAFVQGIGLNDNVHFIKKNDIQDSAKWILAGDVGNWQVIWSGATMAFPDRMYSEGSFYATSCAWFAAACGLSEAESVQVLTDGVFQKTLTRHMGGSNIGFLDGHSKWYSYRTLLLNVNTNWGAYDGPGTATWTASPGSGNNPVKPPAPLYGVGCSYDVSIFK